MAKVKEKKALDKKGWIQSFTLVGKAALGKFTFNIDAHSEKSDYIYSRMLLNVDCGEKYGLVQSQLMGGYSISNPYPVYVHGKKTDEKTGREVDDFDNIYTIDWEDRLDESILEDVGNLCFIRIGIERDKEGKVVEKKFLSDYDATNYLSDTLKDGTEIKVKGQLKYSIYNDAIQVTKQINSIFLKTDKDTPIAMFTQTMLLNKDSVGKLDKDKMVYPIVGMILEKFKEYNGNDLTDGGSVKGGKFVPLRKVFDYEVDPDNKEKADLVISKVFKVKKNITMLTCEGIFVEGGATVQATEADIPADIKELIDLGAYSMEEALAKCSENKGKERRMILKRPFLRMVGEEGSKTLQIQKFEDKYSDEDLMLDYLIKHEEPEEEEDEDEVPFEEEKPKKEEPSDDLDDDSWMDSIA